MKYEGLEDVMKIDNAFVHIYGKKQTKPGRKKLVYVYKGGKSIPSDITTGVRDSSEVQVLSGLNVGDTVITTGLLFLRPGADVKLKKIVQ